MANITEEHLHHLAKRHHQAMKKIDGWREKAAARAGFFFSSLETGAGAYLGGALEGWTKGGEIPVLNVPWNLGIGGALLAASYFDVAGTGWSGHINNLGNGFLSSYFAATGYAFGKRFRETGKLLGGGGSPWGDPYGAPGWTRPADATEDSVTMGDVDMAALVQRMQQAAG